MDVEETPALAARTGVQISNFGAYVDYCVVCPVLGWRDKNLSDEYVVAPCSIKSLHICGSRVQSPWVGPKGLSN